MASSILAIQWARDIIVPVQYTLCLPVAQYMTYTIKAERRKPSRSRRMASHHFQFRISTVYSRKWEQGDDKAECFRYIINRRGKTKRFVCCYHVSELRGQSTYKRARGSRDRLSGGNKFFFFYIFLFYFPFFSFLLEYAPGLSHSSQVVTWRDFSNASLRFS